MKTLIILALTLISLPSFATPVSFKNCFVPETASVRYHTRDVKQLSVDAPTQSALGDINNCPRQITFLSDDAETTIYQLGAANDYHCIYQAVSLAYSRDQSLYCQK